MLDFGATATFINKRFVSQHNILCHPLTRPITLYDIDGSVNKAGSLIHFTYLTINIGSKYTKKLTWRLGSIQNQGAAKGS
jgi:hypothetical protein